MFIIPEFNALGALETYRGSVCSIYDALLVLEGSRLGIIPKVKRRLHGSERECIKHNAVFAWNETECGMKRWTDGKAWSASKVSGPFLVYKELDANKKAKANGLTKQSFLLVTKQNQKLHLIAYYQSDSPKARRPTDDARLNRLALDPEIYSQSLLNCNPNKHRNLDPPPRIRNNSSPRTRSNRAHPRAQSEPNPLHLRAQSEPRSVQTTPRIANLVNSVNSPPPPAQSSPPPRPQLSSPLLSNKRVRLPPPAEVSYYAMSPTPTVQPPQHPPFSSPTPFGQVYGPVTFAPVPIAFVAPATATALMPPHQDKKQHYSPSDTHALHVLDKVFSVQ